MSQPLKKQRIEQAASTSVKTFSSLSDDPIAHIFEFLVFQDILHCQLVCNRFFQLSKSAPALQVLHKYKEHIADLYAKVEAETFDADKLDQLRDDSDAGWIMELKNVADPVPIIRHFRKLQLLRLHKTLISGYAFNASQFAERQKSITGFFSESQMEQVRQVVLRSSPNTAKNHLRVISFDHQTTNGFNMIYQHLLLELPEELNGNANSDVGQQPPQQLLIYQRHVTVPKGNSMYHLCVYTDSPSLASKLQIDVSQVTILVFYKNASGVEMYYTEDQMKEITKLMFPTATNWNHKDCFRLLMGLSCIESSEMKRIERNVRKAEDVIEIDLCWSILQKPFARQSMQALDKLLTGHGEDAAKMLMQFTQDAICNQVMRQCVGLVDLYEATEGNTLSTVAQQMVIKASHHLKHFQGQNICFDTPLCPMVHLVNSKFEMKADKSTVQFTLDSRVSEADTSITVTYKAIGSTGDETSSGQLFDLKAAKLTVDEKAANQLAKSILGVDLAPIGTWTNKDFALWCLITGCAFCVKDKVKDDETVMLDLLQDSGITKFLNATTFWSSL